MQKKILLITLILLSQYIEVFSQCTTTILSSGITTSNARCPMTRYRNARSHYLITAAEMSAAGFTPGKAVSGISWNYPTAPSVGGTGTLTVYLENTADVTNLKNSSWPLATASMQLVHTGATTLPATAGFFDVNFTGGTPFTYTGGGIYVAFDWSYCAGTLDNTGLVGCNTTLANGLKGAQNVLACLTLTVLSAASSRPDTRFISSVPNDVKVDYVYTLGEMPLGYTTGHIVKAWVTNSSNSAFTNFPVTLNILGANTFSNVQIIGNLAACTSQTVSFAGFTPAANGYDTVRVTIPPDNNNANNSMEAIQQVTNNSYHYRYVGETPTTGVGFSGSTGAITTKFTTNAPLTITHINIEFNTTNLPYKLAIYPDVAGNPGTVPLYIDATNRLTINGGPTDEMLASPVVVPAGNFYAAVHQTGNANAAVIYSPEAPLRTSSFYFTSPLPVAFWIDLGPSNGSYRPLLGVKFCNQTTPDSIFGNTIVCEGSTNTYSVTPLFGATSYTWTLPPGWTGSSTTNVIYATAGSSGGNVSCMVTYPCGNSSTESIAVSVNPSTGILAPITSNHSQYHADGLSIDYYNANCDLIASLSDVPGGFVPGQTTATVNVDLVAGFHNFQPFVRRWYQITPATPNGEGDVILYINQSDFDDYNTVVLPPYLPLPTSGSNADPNIPNIRITKNDDAGLGNNPIVLTPTVNWNGNYWELSFHTPGFSQFRVHSANPDDVALPVNVTSFTGKKINDGDELSWTTGSEQNNAKFNLQHSTNGIDFKTIAKVNSKAPNGNSSSNLSYIAVHNKPVQGHNYYRLQQVDIDNRKSYHAKIVDLIRGINGNTLSLYPNPTRDILNIDLNASAEQNTTVKVLDMSGRTLKQVQAKSTQGLNNITMSLGDLDPGLYTIQVFENDNLMHTSTVRKSD